MVVLIEGLVLDLAGHRQVGVDAVEEKLHALVLVGRADEHRRGLEGDRGAADGRNQVFGRDGLLGQELLGQDVVDVGDRFNHAGVGAALAVSTSSAGMSASRDVLAAVAFEVDGLHLDQIHDALEAILGADGDLQRDGMQGRASL